MNVKQTTRALLSDLVGKGLLSEKEFEFVEDYPLSLQTTFRTGGPADTLFPLTLGAASVLYPALYQAGIPTFVLGNGSNVLAQDSGYDGVILSLSRFKETTVSGCEITATAGVSITGLAVTARKHSLGGMEFFYGIPGSVGGAVFMNAGAYGGECKDVLRSVTFVTRDGSVRTLPVEQLKMGYRTSIFETGDALILSATFSLNPASPEEIAAKMEDLMGRREAKQPLEYPSAGSTFKRCEGRFTAQMIDEAGLKGLSVGGARVSEKHAGFIINYDNATSRDILDVIDRVKAVILEKEGLAIECEVRLIQ